MSLGGTKPWRPLCYIPRVFSCFIRDWPVSLSYFLVSRSSGFVSCAISLASILAFSERTVLTQARGGRWQCMTCAAWAVTWDAGLWMENSCRLKEGTADGGCAACPLPFTVSVTWPTSEGLSDAPASLHLTVPISTCLCGFLLGKAFIKD